MSRQSGKSSAKPSARPKKGNLWQNLAGSRFTPWAFLAVFAVVAYILLPGLNHSYLRKVEDQSIFMSGAQWWTQCVDIPGGFLSYCGSYLTQFFYYPWLGGTMFILLLAGLWLAVWHVGRMPRSLFGMASVPSAMMLLALLAPGYMIYCIKTPGYPYIGLLGFASSLAIFEVSRHIGQKMWCRTLYVVLAVGLLYVPSGFYALLGVGMCVLREFRLNRRTGAVMLVAATVCGALVPWWYYVATETHVMKCNLYISGLPRIDSYTAATVTPYIVSIIFLLASALLAPSERKEGASRHAGRNLSIGVLAFIAALTTVFAMRHRDENFDTSVAMDMAIRDNDCKKAVEEARAHKENPTRVVGLLTHIALNRLGQAGDSLFTFPIDAVEYDSPRSDRSLRDVLSRSLNYNFGRINDAYRWCMEDMVEYGPKVEYLKYMVKCALLNEETALARRYLRMLGRTTFHKTWADRYMAYAENPKLMDKDPEFAAVRPLMAYNNMIGGDDALIEAFVSTMISNYAGGPPQLVELSMQFNLIQKNIDNFWPRFMLYARHNKRLPVHYQEAAILFSALEGKVDWRQFAIDPDVQKRFEGFMQMAQQNAGNSDAVNRELFRSGYGNTYWYYYFFVKDLKTT